MHLTFGLTLDGRGNGYTYGMAGGVGGTGLEGSHFGSNFGILAGTGKGKDRWQGVTSSTSFDKVSKMGILRAGGVRNVTRPLLTIATFLADGLEAGFGSNIADVRTLRELPYSLLFI